jgi:hypothetical protein
MHSQLEVELAHLIREEAAVSAGVVAERAAIDRIKTILFLATLTVTCILLVDMPVSEVSLLGFKISHLEASKSVIVVPVLLAYFHAYYTLRRIRLRQLALKADALNRELADRTGLSLDGIYHHRPYTSHRGTKYRVTDRDRLHLILVRFLTTFMWAPFVLAFVLSAVFGAKVAAAVSDPLYRRVYYTAVVASALLIMLSRYTTARAYRQGVNT